LVPLKPRELVVTRLFLQPKKVADRIGRPERFDRPGGVCVRI
jgi:hypothetical protein